ncbi:LCP family protein [Streptomyces sp. Z26]|uniref:LCP family protein n=1 Tax=Streptomyces sp. Z26 TaxID=2500177 RepID=UPI000EF13A7E|nr:LCP family protein [Streptomyces sp. Z26]RLL66751.1 LytR family transcriptional regulator [Streptomyces sp. Z26]
MTDGYGYDPYGRQPRVLGYDEYGRPVYEQDPQQAHQQQHTGQQQQQQPYGYDPYGPATDSGHQQPVQDAYQGDYQGGTYGGGYDPYDPYGSQSGHGAYQGQTGYADPTTGYADPADVGHTGRLPRQQPYGYDPYGPATDSGHQQPVQAPHAPDPHAPDPHAPDPYAPDPGYDPYGPAADTGGRVPRQAEPPAAEREPEGGYQTEQFSFVEEEADDSEDVIDWLKFSESRTERREEAKRRGRNRTSALVVLLVLAVVGGLGYLWQAGKLPGSDDGDDGGKTAAGEKRDVLAVHLLSTDSDASSTALLVDNATAKQGTTLLLPNSLAVSTADGATTTLGKSVESEGATPTRDSLDRLFGAQIKGTWRLDTPYLEILVDSVGGITLDTDTDVPGAKKGDKPVVTRGEGSSLDGRAAVAYATYGATGEDEAKQLARFGQVMEAVLQKTSSDRSSATNTVKSLGQILDPSLSEESLGATLAGLSALAKDGAFDTKVLPVETNGTLSRTTSDSVAKKILGGTVKNSDPSAAPTVSVRAGGRGDLEAARVALVNGGFTVVDGGQGGGGGGSRVTYADEARKTQAVEVAKTLGLAESAVRKGKGADNADVTVELGGDYEG